MVFALSKSDDEPVQENDPTLTDSSDNQQALISEQKLEGYAADIEESSPALDVVMIARGKNAAGESGEWNLVLDKGNGLLRVYKDGEDTGSYSYTVLNGDYAIMRISDGEKEVDPEQLPAPKIDNAYEVNYYTGLGIIKYFQSKEYSIELSVETTEYVDVFMVDEGNKKVRVLVTDGVTFVSHDITEVPNVDNYVNIK